MFARNWFAYDHYLTNFFFSGENILFPDQMDSDLDLGSLSATQDYERSIDYVESMEGYDEEYDSTPPPAKRRKGAPRVPRKGTGSDRHTERALRRWHLISFDMDVKRKDIVQRFEHSCNHWCFQLEKGKREGNLHWQCRVSFEPALRKSQVVKLFPEFSVRIESEAGTKAGGLYAMKADTRQDGPWSDRDVEHYKDPRYVLKDYRDWQTEMKKRLDSQDARTILVIVDETGNTGKTCMAHHLVQYHNGVFIPPFCSTGDEILQFACSFVKPGEMYTFVIDMPRALLMRHVAARLFAAFETLKSGYVYDKRYHGKYVYFQIPKVVVFTNTVPEQTLLTGDRWDIMTLPWVSDKAEASKISYAQGHPQVVDPAVVSEANRSAFVRQEEEYALEDINRKAKEAMARAKAIREDRD